MTENYLKTLWSKISVKDWEIFTPRIFHSHSVNQKERNSFWGKLMITLLTINLRTNLGNYNYRPQEKNQLKIDKSSSEQMFIRSSLIFFMPKQKLFNKKSHQSINLCVNKLWIINTNNQLQKTNRVLNICKAQSLGAICFLHLH